MPKRFGMNDVFGLGQSSIAPFVLDRLPATAGSWSFGRRKRRGWLGPVGTLYRTSDGVEIPVFGQGRWGLVGTRFVRAFNGWNLLTHSNGFSNANWFKGSPATVTLTPNAAANPITGANDAWLLQEVDGANIPRLQQGIVSSGLAYTFSVFAKANTRNQIAIRWDGSFGRASFFTLTGSGTAVTGALATSSAIVNLGNGWYRCSSTATVSAAAAPYIATAESNATIASGDSTKSALIFGSQLELGSSTSTYDPRTTVAAGNVLWSRLFDQTGNGRHFEQANAALMPYASRGGVPVTENGVLAGEFVASEARRMQIANSTAAYNFLHTTGGTVAFVAKANNTADRKALLANKLGTASSGLLVEYQNTEVLTWYAGRRDVGGVATNGATITLEPAVGEASIANQIVVGELDPDNATAANRGRVWRNGTASAATNAETSTPFIENAQGNLTLGARSDGTLAHDGTISDVDLWQGFLSTSERGIYQRDASRHYGMAIA